MENSDRFIPNRSGMDLSMSNFNLLFKENIPLDREQYCKCIAEHLFPEGLNPRILCFKEKPVAPLLPTNTLRLFQQHSKEGGPKCKPVRFIPTTAEKILDAPDIVDDYYLNLLDWSSKNVISIALNTALFLWNADTATAKRLISKDSRDRITSVSWANDGVTLAIGLDNTTVQIWDVEAEKRLRVLRDHHYSRVNCLAWNDHILSTGGKDTIIFNHDVRIKEHVISRLQGHSQEICGLKYSSDFSQLASGGNDNKICVWNASTFQSNNVTPRFELTGHNAAVKALSWAPFQKNLLASGGGTQDKTIKFWNTYTGEQLTSIDTNSQVCTLLWSRHSRELVSSHGYEDYQLSVWKYPSLARIADLKGHEARVLYTALSPDGQTVVSAAADETIRFWKVFDCPKKHKADSAPTQFDLR